MLTISRKQTNLNKSIMTVKEMIMELGKYPLTATVNTNIPMTVQDLIEKLETYPPDNTVHRINQVGINSKGGVILFYKPTTEDDFGSLGIPEEEEEMINLEFDRYVSDRIRRFNRLIN